MSIRSNRQGDESNWGGGEEADKGTYIARTIDISQWQCVVVWCFRSCIGNVFGLHGVNA